MGFWLGVRYDLGWVFIWLIIKKITVKWLENKLATLLFAKFTMAYNIFKIKQILFHFILLAKQQGLECDSIHQTPELGFKFYSQVQVSSYNFIPADSDSTGNKKRNNVVHHFCGLPSSLDSRKVTGLLCCKV